MSGGDCPSEERAPGSDGETRVANSLDPRCVKCGETVTEREVRRHYPHCPTCDGRLRLAASAAESKDEQGSDRQYDDLSTLAAAIDSLGARVHQLGVLDAATDPGTRPPDGQASTAASSDLTFACPDCGDESRVVPAHVAADELHEAAVLTAELLEELSRNTHACLDCKATFTP